MAWINSGPIRPAIQAALVSIESSGVWVDLPDQQEVRMVNFPCPLKDALGRRLIEVYRAVGDPEQVMAEHDESSAFLEMRLVEEQLRRHNEICPLCKLKSYDAVLRTESSWRGTMAG